MKFFGLNTIHLNVVCERPLTNINEPVCCIQHEKRTHGECFINWYIPPTTAKSLDIFGSTLSTRLILFLWVHYLSTSACEVCVCSCILVVCTYYKHKSSLGCIQFRAAPRTKLVGRQGPVLLHMLCYIRNTIFLALVQLQCALSMVIGLFPLKVPQYCLLSV